MLAAMMQAEVGDDVYGEDPTVNKLEAMLADMSGMEAAVFAPTGTQSNLLGIMSHCQRGDEYIVGQKAHTYLSEGGGAAVLGSVQPQPIDFEEDGCLSLEKVFLAIKPNNFHYARTRLLCLENTQLGKVLPLNYLNEVKAFCHTHNLASHLDGARVFNATVQQKVALADISKNFDSISICLSKGLGTPAGSVLCGSKDLISTARRWRKVLGGGMRQVGYLAAAGIYALENNINRLEEDHYHARLLAEGLEKIEELTVDSESLQTNILFIKVSKDYPQLQTYLSQKGIILPPQANKMNKIRLVTHLDIVKEDIGTVINTIKNYYRNRL
jgi:threonine aldolase